MNGKPSMGELERADLSVVVPAELDQNTGANLEMSLSIGSTRFRAINPSSWVVYKGRITSKAPEAG
jgi:uncharacterized protein YaiE (UPF0345 family)